MSTRPMIPSLVETTNGVEPARAFEFWRDTALKPVGHVTRVNPHGRFSARRLAAASSHGTWLMTQSSPVAVEADLRHVRRTGQDDMVVTVPLEGRGYADQAGTGALLRPGDVGFVTMGRPYAIGAVTPYREIRFSVPRAAFEGQAGRVEALAGRHIPAGAASEPFLTHVRAVADAIAAMSDHEVGFALEGVLHLLRPLLGGTEPEAGLSTNVLRSLARVRIERCLHDAAFGPEALGAVLNVSRSKLYRAFADSEGPATAIRDARLDRAWQWLSSPASDGVSIKAILYACGFNDAPTFSKAFRNRFGHSARDVRALRARP